MKVLCAPMEISLGHPEKNATSAMFLIEANKNVDYILLPPLFLTGCTCGILFEFSFFIEQQNKHLSRIISSMPEHVKVISTIMENGSETPVVFDSQGIINCSEINIATNIHEIKKDKTNFLCIKHKWHIGSVDELLWQLKGTSTYFTASGKGESSSHDVYSGACGGVMGDICTVKRFTPVVIDASKGYEDLIKEPNIYPDPLYPFVPSSTEYLDEAVDIMSYALRRRLNHLGSDKVVIGVSGGLDSTLALLIADNVILNKKDIIGITMPGLGTGSTTRTNAEILMNQLGIDSRSISIENAVLQHFKDINHDNETHDIAYENAQARERMQILFDVSNMEKAINIGTGDMSEAMLGFTTFGGDHLSMYNINIGVPKTLVRALVLHFAWKIPRISSILTSIATTPISPELIPGKQETETIVGSYKANDFAIYHTIVSNMDRGALSSLLKMVGLHLNLDDFYRRITNSQFKRNCSADGVPVTRCFVDDFILPSDCKNIF